MMSDSECSACSERGYEADDNDSDSSLYKPFKTIYIALVGNPVVEVAAMLRYGEKVVDVYHAIISYDSVITNESLYELSPQTDYYGTLYEHGISELELEQFGIPLQTVRSDLQTFLNLNNTFIPIIVNNFHRFQSLQLGCDPTGVYDNVSVSKRQTSIYGKRCKVHQSSYYTSQAPCQCALIIAGKMVLRDTAKS